MTFVTNTTSAAAARWTWAVRAPFLLPTLLTPQPLPLPVYPLAAIRFLTGTESDPPEVTRAKALGNPDKTRIDRGMQTTYSLPASVSGETYVDFAMPGWGPFGLLPRMPKLSVRVALEGGDIEFFNYPLAGAYHWIKVKPRKGAARTEKVYKHPDGKGETSWTTCVLCLLLLVVCAR